MTGQPARRRPVASLACALFVLFAPVAATADDYIFDIAKRDPKIIPLWSSIVPPDYARQPWIKGLDGTTGLVERVVVDGKPFYLGSVCKPHDCYRNNVVFLIANDHSACYGLLSSEALKVAGKAFGFPGPQALQIMQRFLNR